MTRTPRALSLTSIRGWARAHPVPTAVAGMALAIAGGVALSIAIDAVRGRGIGAPEASPTAAFVASPDPTATDSAPPTPEESPTPSPSPRSSPSVIPPSAAPSTPGPTASPTPTAPVNGRIAWDAPGQAGGGSRDVMSANPDGGDPSFHTASANEERNAVWSPDGRSLAYISSASDGSVEVLGPGGRHVVVHRGSFPPGTYYSDGVAWAPDGARLAMALVPGGIEIVDLDGNVTAFVNAREPRHVAWSPSGDLLAYVEGTALMVADGRTAATRTVTSMATNVRFPMWTPDERTLLFLGYTESGNTDLFAVSLDGTGLRNVTDTVDLFEDVPAISPDGTRVAMVIIEGSTQRIEVLNLDGGERRTLLTMEGSGSAAWAPDGTALAVGHGERITVVPLDGSQPVDIGIGSAPSWGTSGSVLGE